MEPMASRLGVDMQGLQQLITESPWDEQPLWATIQREVVPSLEPLEAWIVDECGWVKQGRDSVGVSHQYCGAVGKQANCQVSVELAVSDGWVVSLEPGYESIRREYGARIKSNSFDARSNQSTD